MMIVAMSLVGYGLVVRTADHVPNLDVKSTCRAAIEMTGDTNRTLESCLAGENGARKQLEKDWSKFPGGERSQCLATSGGRQSPSYVELVICLEMMGDSRKHHEEERAASKAKKSTNKP